MLATVGETIGEENPDIRGDMQEACRESRNVSSGLEKLCESLSHTVIGKNDKKLYFLLCTLPSTTEF